MEANPCPDCGTALSVEVGCPQCLLSLGLGRTATSQAETRAIQEAGAHPTSRVGPYKLLDRLGEGGMGIVYLAEQEEPIRRRVALKLIKLGMDTKQVLARFESERQALAILSHPNIAQVYDAGTNEQGRPYFVMEHVPGIPITRFCDQERLGMRRRLELFLQVCEAVQHAHQKGIIHRDLKPSNVLVHLVDNRPAPKVIDFGVAKATSQRLTQQTLYTELGAMVGTPEYMSPEQADPSALDIDTRTDIYSLGVLLYELLVGVLPYEPHRLRKVGYSEMQRILREETPPRPSVRVNTLASAKQMARLRGRDVPALRRALRGDLDWVVMRALERERARRYDTASELAADLRRYLSNEPVVARPPDLLYRSRKFIGKHRGSVVAAAAIVLTIVVMGAVAFFQGLRTREQAMRVRANGILLAAAGVEDPLLKALLLAELAEIPELPGRLRIAHEAARTPLPIYVLRGHEGSVRGAAFSPDGRWALTASSDATAKIWRLDGREAPALLARHTDWINTAVFSPDGTRVLTGSDDNTAMLWPVDGGSEPIALRGHENFVWSAAFSKDGKQVVTASRDGTARVWQADGKDAPVVLRGHEIDTRSLATDSDGQRIALKTADVLSAAFSPDGKRVITGATDGTARVWRTDGTRDPVILRGHDDVVFDADFSPDGSRAATASADGTVRLWNVRDWETIEILLGHEGPIHDVDFSSDGTRLATASGDQTARIWKLDGSGEFIVLRGHAGSVFSATFSSDGTLVITASDDGTARVWPTAWKAASVILRGHDSEVNTATYSPDGTHVVTASSDGTARVWRADGTGRSLELHGHKGAVNDASFSPDGSLVVTASSDHTARVWRIDATGEPLVLRGHSNSVRRAVFNPSGRRVATASADGTARIWSLDESKATIVLDGHERGVVDVAFSPDGSHVTTGSTDGRTRVWRADGTGEPVILDAGAGPVLSVAFNSGGDLVVAASEHDTAHIWRADGAGDPIVFEGHQDWVRRATFSPDGSRIVTASDDHWARVWRSDGKGDPMLLHGHENYVLDAVFSPDGELIVTASWDRTARVWRADGAGAPLVLRGHDGDVDRAAFSPDGTHVITASADGTARIWLVSWEVLLDHLRAGTRACLTLDQRMRFLAETSSEAQAALAECERRHEQTGR